jgi:hypothetical protein
VNVSKGTLSYQWYSNDAHSNSGGNPLGASDGAQTENYTPPTTTLGTVYYYCIVTNTNTGSDITGNQTAATMGNTAAVIVIDDTTIASLTASPNGVLSPAFNAVPPTTYGVVVPSYAGVVTFTANPTNTAPATLVTYAIGASDIFSDAEPAATLSGLTGSVTFRVKVVTTSENIWGPYTFNVSRAMAYTIDGGLVYETFEGDDYEGIKFTGGPGTFTLAALDTSLTRAPPRWVFIRRSQRKGRSWSDLIMRHYGVSTSKAPA